MGLVLEVGDQPEGCCSNLKYKMNIACIIKHVLPHPCYGTVLAYMVLLLRATGIQ